MTAVSVGIAGAPLRVAAAEADGSAAQEFARGVELADRGAFAEALEAFKRAYELRPHRAVLYNLGLVAAALGRRVEAVDYLRRYLAESDGPGGTTAERRRSVVEQIATLERGIGTLAISVDPHGARVVVDDQLIGTSPLPQGLRVDAGTHRIVAELPGHSPALAAVTVHGGATQAVRLVLAPVPAQGAPPKGLGWLIVGCPAAADVEVDGNVVARMPGETTLTIPEGSHQVRFVAAAREPHVASIDLEPLGTARAECPWPPVDPEEVARTQRFTSWAYALWTGAVVLGGTALGLTIWNEGRYEDWRRDFDRTAFTGGDPATNAATLDSLNDRRDGIDTTRVLATTAAIAAGVALVTGVVVYQKRGPRVVAEPQSFALRWSW